MGVYTFNIWLVSCLIHHFSEQLSFFEENALQGLLHFGLDIIWSYI